MAQERPGKIHLIFDKQSGGDCVLFSRRLHRILRVNLLIGLSCQLADWAKQFCLMFEATRTYPKKGQGSCAIDRVHWFGIGHEIKCRDVHVH